jgi:hypothetical protein
MNETDWTIYIGFDPAAHIKTHSGTKSMVHLKNPKLRPPASKFIVSQTRINQYDTLPNTNRYLANSRFHYTPVESFHPTNTTFNTHVVNLTMVKHVS